MAASNIIFTVKCKKTIWYYLLILSIKIRSEKLAYYIAESKKEKLIKIKVL